MRKVTITRYEIVNDQSIGEFCSILNFTSRKRTGITKGSVTQARNIEIRLSPIASKSEKIIRAIIASETISSTAATKLAKR